RLQLGLPLDLPLELDDAALRDVTRQFRRYEQVLRQFEEASQQAARLGSAANLRAELRRLAAEAPLVQKTRFQREFSEHWAGWERITTAELKMRISRIRADLRRLLDQLTEKERSGKTLTAEDRAPILAAENDLAVGVFEMALREYEEQPWKTETNEA